MIAVKQVGLSAFAGQPPEPSFAGRIKNFLQSQDGHKWAGTAFALAKELSYSINSPRALAVRLRHAHDELRKCGVTVSYKAVRGSRIIVLSLARKAAAAARLPGEPGEPSGCSKIIEISEPVEFPFTWPFATITALSPEEAREKNEWQVNGRVRTRRPCSLCGTRGTLEFVKTAPGATRAYLCQSCAEDYVKKARRVMERLGGDRTHETKAEGEQ